MENALGELKAVIAHLSDLHFCDVFSNTEDRLSSLIGAAPHHFNLLLDLDTAFHKIPKSIKDKFGLTNKPEINLVVMTGDLTTTANTGAFEEANNYLRWSKYIGPKGPDIGLKMRDEVLVVPGNHDTWFTRLKKKYWFFNEIENRSEAYEKCFPSCPDIVPKQYDGVEFLFICLDSNKTKKKLKNISRGGLDETDLATITNSLVKKNRDKVFKIALLHHHPWLPSNVVEE